MPARSALNRLLVLLDVLHLLANKLGVYMGRHTQGVEAFHYFFILLINSLCLFLFDDEVERAFLLKRSRVIHERASAHLRLV